MKILMVTLAYDPAFAFGGPGRVVQTNARELVRRGHTVSVHCTNRLNTRAKLSKRTFERSDDGVRVVYHNTWHIPGWPGSFGPTFSPSFAAVLKEASTYADIIHVNEARAFTTIQAAKAARRSGTPLILQPHGSITLGLRMQRLKRFYDKLGGGRVYQEAARVLALSEEEAIDCAQAGIDPDRIALVSNSINVNSWKKERGDREGFRTRYGIPRGANLVLFLGRLDPKKGPDLLIEAFAAAGGSDAYLAFVGPDDGQLAESVRLVAAKQITERTIFTGYLTGDDLLNAYAAADVFALPARFDSFPIALTEALSCALPILTTSTNQASRLVKDRAGLVVDPTARALAAGLHQLLTKKDLRERFSRNARKIAEEELSISAAVDTIEAIYREAVEGSTSR